MQHDPLKAFIDSAVDLKPAQNAEPSREEAVEQARQELAMRAAVEQVQRWDRAMNRAFKGIVSRPKRHKMLLTKSTAELALDGE